MTFSDNTDYTVNLEELSKRNFQGVVLLQDIQKKYSWLI